MAPSLRRPSASPLATSNLRLLLIKSLLSPPPCLPLLPPPPCLPLLPPPPPPPPLPLPSPPPPKLMPPTVAVPTPTTSKAASIGHPHHLREGAREGRRIWDAGERATRET